MTEREYLLFCDESDQQGRFYSNFYGGVIIGASHYEAVTHRLEACKMELNLYAEVKWAKVTERYLDKYQRLVQAFFREVSTGHVRMRVMFRQNCHQSQGLTLEQEEQEYYRLYYQFIKHGFGICFMPPRPGGSRLRLYFDQFPDTGDKVRRFKEFLLALQRTPEFRAVKVHIFPEDITEVDSHEHVLLQCLDIVLGAMAFRLNDKHKEKPEGARRRGKRTIAKEKLYGTILGEIRTIYPNFNVGISTGTGGQPARRWSDPYRHWAFVPAQTDYDERLTKRRRNTENPA